MKQREERFKSAPLSAPVVDTNVPLSKEKTSPTLKSAVPLSAKEVADLDELEKRRKRAERFGIVDEPVQLKKQKK